jgi:DNA-directed RNA polymerase specialized sigma24 family protein
MDLVQWRAIGECLRADRLAWAFMVMRDPDSWRRYLRHHDLHDLAVRLHRGEGTYGLFAHDWRTTTAESWLERMGRRGQSGPRAAAPPESSGLRVLARPEFDSAVREAMRSLSRPGALIGNPLTRTRLVADHPSPDPAQALRELLEEAVEQVGADPRAARQHQAVVSAYLSRVPTQEAAAERLGLPISTFRRHLAGGLERVAERLWHREVYEAAEVPPDV